jgi:hypothetical protein
MTNVNQCLVRAWGSEYIIASKHFHGNSLEKIMNKQVIYYMHINKAIFFFHIFSIYYEWLDFSVKSKGFFEVGNKNLKKYVENYNIGSGPQFSILFFPLNVHIKATKKWYKVFFWRKWAQVAIWQGKKN